MNPIIKELEIRIKNALRSTKLDGLDYKQGNHVAKLTVKGVVKDFFIEKGIVPSFDVRFDRITGKVTFYQPIELKE